MIGSFCAGGRLRPPDTYSLLHPPLQRPAMGPFKRTKADSLRTSLTVDIEAANTRQSRHDSVLLTIFNSNRLTFENQAPSPTTIRHEARLFDAIVVPAAASTMIKQLKRQVGSWDVQTFWTSSRSTIKPRSVLGGPSGIANFEISLIGRVRRL